LTQGKAEKIGIYLKSGSGRSFAKSISDIAADAGFHADYDGK
jgi:hypothetical protein